MARAQVPTSEATLQKWFIKELRREGFVVYKFASPSNRGVPDLIIIPSGGRPTVFVEMKSPSGKGKVSALQQHHIEVLRKQGQQVWVASSQEDCWRIMDTLEKGV